MNSENSLYILQPHIPHYREAFFRKLAEKRQLRLLCYENLDHSKSGFSDACIPFSNIQAISIGPILWYNPLAFLKSKSKIWILMLHYGHLTTWLLLLTSFIHRRKIILWGQGISVKRYLKEEQKEDWKLKLMLSLANGAWLYTDKEAEQWRKIFQKKQIVSLNNTQTILGGEKKPKSEIDKLKQKYGIVQERILIFSARFENPYRRVDILSEVIESLDPDKFGFIIIGSGSLKPDFKNYKNVYDFGKLYDEKIKSDLFSIADIYFQPGWVGLSIVEAMAYSLPIFTFKRTDKIKQCVEYSYIVNNENGFLFTILEDCISRIINITDEDLQIMGKKSFEKKNMILTVENMVANAIESL